MDIVTTHFYSNSLTIEKQTHCSKHIQIFKTNIRILYYNRFRIINKKTIKIPCVSVLFCIFFSGKPGLSTIPDFYHHVDKYHPGHLPTRTSTIPDFLPPCGQIPSRTNTIPDIYQPGTSTIPDFYHHADKYHPGQIPSRTFYPSRTFTTKPGLLPSRDIYHPGRLPPCGTKYHPGHIP